jgi:hypothetical protein
MFHNHRRRVASERVDMAHVLFIEPSVPAIDAMRRAKELEHRVSLIRSSTFRCYPDDESTDAVLRSLDRCVDIRPRLILTRLRTHLRVLWTSIVRTQ